MPPKHSKKLIRSQSDGDIGGNLPSLDCHYDIFNGESRFITEIRNALAYVFKEKKLSFEDVFDVISHSYKEHYKSFHIKCKIMINSPMVQSWPESLKTVILKVEPIFVNNDYSNNGLEVEREMYEITENLIIRDCIPHFFRSYGSYTLDKCPLPSDYPTKELKEIKQYEVLVLKYVEGMKLEYVFSNLNLGIHEFYLILFQIFYCLCCFQDMKFSHNDLHDNNIIIRKYPQRIALTYKVGKKAWRIYTKYIVFIYDFDRASNVIGEMGGHYNLSLTKAEYDIIGGQTNTFRQHDTFNVLWTFYSTKHTLLSTFFKKIFSSECNFIVREQKYKQYPKQFKFPGYLKLDEKYEDYFKPTKKVFAILRNLMRKANILHHATPIQIEKQSMNYFVPPNIPPKWFTPEHEFDEHMPMMYWEEKNFPQKIQVDTAFHHELLATIFPEAMKSKIDYNWKELASQLFNILMTKNDEFKCYYVMAQLLCHLLSLTYWYKVSNNVRKTLFRELAKHYMMKMWSKMLILSVGVTITVNDEKKDIDNPIKLNIEVYTYNQKNYKWTHDKEFLTTEFIKCYNKIWQTFKGVLPIKIPQL